jgi:chromosome partitioning protein
MIISIFNHLSGSGKSTSCLNLAKALVESDHRVLLVDMSDQGGLSRMLSLDDNRPSIFTALLSGEPLQSFVEKCEGIDVVPSGNESSRQALAGSSPFLLHFGQRNSFQEYDYVLLDCPSTLSYFSLNALLASDYIIVPFRPDPLSIGAIGQVKAIIDFVGDRYQKEIEVKGLLPVRITDERYFYSEEYQYLTTHYEYPVFHNHIAEDLKVSTAPYFGRSVVSYDPNCMASRNYFMLAQELSSQVYLKPNII